MSRRILFLIALMIAVPMVVGYAQESRAQYGFEFQELTHKIEITPMGGYVWTASREGYYDTVRGNLDLESNGYWGVAVDITLPKPGAQLELLYRRQDTEMTWKPAGGLKQTISDTGVEYWQIGMVGGMKRGNVMPFSLFTLGASRFDFKDSGLDDEWKFAMTFGLGAKVYMGERIALRLQGTMPFTFTNGGAGVGCNFGGCYPSFGGTGIFQFDLTAGIAILL